MKLDELGADWRKAYERMVESYQTTYAAAIARYYRPKKLYKYFDFSTQYYKKNICDGNIVFNNPCAYNDPMDSRWFLDFEKIVKERFKEAEEAWDEEKVGALIRDTIPLYEEDSISFRSLFKISCFSESPCSNLMWGHYGEKHKGFCLEYDTEKMDSKIKLILPVIYTEKPFQAWQLVDKRGIAESWIVEITPCLYKSKDWSYEREWRAVAPMVGVEKTIIPVPDCVTGIFFGLECYCTERKEIEQWAKENHVETYQMERTYCSYDLTYDTCDDVRHGRHKGLLS